MPLIKSKSKRAFEQNVETEMKAHPEASKRAQNLAIAYSVKRKAQAKKKMAEGGAISAKDERRPMPKARHDDAAMVARNDNMKPLKDSSWTDTPTERQAMAKNSKRVVPIKRPKMVPTDAFSVKLYDDEDDMQKTMPPATPDEQAPAMYPKQNAHMGEDPDMPKPHTTAKAYAKGGMASGSMDEDEAEHAHMADQQSMEYGAVPENDALDEPVGLESDDDQMRPAEDDYMSMRDAAAYADGGSVEDEAEMEHAASIAAAIMAKMRKKMAEGGEISDKSILGHDDSMFDFAKSRKPSTMGSEVELSDNAEESPNNEDQMSFNALRKENYSENEGLNQLDSPADSNMHGNTEMDEENVHDSDIVRAIRRKMKMKSPITR